MAVRLILLGMSGRLERSWVRVVRWEVVTWDRVSVLGKQGDRGRQRERLEEIWGPGGCQTGERARSLTPGKFTLAYVFGKLKYGR